MNTIEDVLDALPATATEVASRLGMSHEETYMALVALEAAGQAFVTSSTPRRCPRVMSWEPA